MDEADRMFDMGFEPQVNIHMERLLRWALSEMENREKGLTLLVKDTIDQIKKGKKNSKWRMSKAEFFFLKYSMYMLIF